MSARILLVEDHHSTRRALAYLLLHSGFDVTAVASKAEALNFCANHDFDLLICDVALADGSGLELMQELAGRCNTRGIAYTTRDRPEELAGISEAGFFATLIKPADYGKLEGLIQQALGSHTSSH